ncbi:MAG: hypothetical protein AAF125_09550, partial [Chloroflexota bacterium]
MSYRPLIALAATIVLLSVVSCSAFPSPGRNRYSGNAYLTATAIIRGATETSVFVATSTASAVQANQTGTASMGGLRLDVTQPPTSWPVSTPQSPAIMRETAEAFQGTANAAQLTSTAVLADATQTLAVFPSATPAPLNDGQRTATSVVVSITETLNVLPTVQRPQISDSQITATAIIAGATATRYFIEVVPATETANAITYGTTRTAVAITREQSLISNATPAPPERTATALYAQLTENPPTPSADCTTAHIFYEDDSGMAGQLYEGLSGSADIDAAVLSDVTVQIFVEAIGEWSAETGVCDRGDKLRVYVYLHY